MMPKPNSTDRRVRYLKKLNLLDSLPEEAYDAITELAAHICGTPISLVSLLGDDRQFFKSRYGLELTETPIEYSFCAHAIQTPDKPFIVKNATEDERFKKNPLVTGDPKIRFYAGIPLITGNQIPLGTLSVIDRKPRELNEDQLRALKNLATQITQLFEYRLSEIEVELARSEHKFRALVQDGGDLIAILDQEGVYTYVSPTSTPILGIEPEEFIGLTAFEFIHPEDRPLVREQFDRLAEEHQVHVRPFRFQNKEGEWRWIETIATNMLDDPSIEGIVANSRDVTKFKETHLELQELNEELAHSNAELEQFAYVASHDLQEPLRMVSSFMSLLEKKYGHLLDEKAHEYIHYATDGAKRMKTIIVDLLEYSKAGRNQERASLVNLNRMLRDYQDLRQQRIEESGATIEYKKLPSVVAREAPLLQTLHSLLDNAIKYVSPDRPPRIRITVRETDTEWTVTVFDNGIGIAPEYQEKIFVLFQRLHQQEEYDGTGIGLAVAKKQVESWGGTLKVESAEDEGSTFSFTIPKSNG